MADDLPLTALLSQALVALTIEFDNEFERRMPHRTTDHGATAGSRQAPWLVSMVMWSNCMRFVGEGGVTVRDLEGLARTGTNLDGMRRWGYITLDPAPAGTRSRRPRPDTVIRPTAAGRQAREVWRPLFGVIEGRWRERFGDDEVERLRRSLWAVAGRLGDGLPDCLPILGHGLFSRGPRSGAGRERPAPPVGGEEDEGAALPLPALLSRVLLALALEFEGASEVSLATSANVLRVLDETGVRERDLPPLSGVSTEAISMAVGPLLKGRLAVVELDSAGGRAKLARLTPAGLEARNAYRHLLDGIEARWGARFGADALGALRASLARLAGDPAAPSPLWSGLEPYPDGWRSSVRRPITLPHYPVVLHRGGFPDGA